jgi:hypothetical protein
MWLEEIRTQLRVSVVYILAKLLTRVPTNIIICGE